MSDEAEISGIVLAALQNADINFPDVGDGTVRDAVYRNDEEGRHLGRAILAPLREAGLRSEKQATMPTGPKRPNRPSDAVGRSSRLPGSGRPRKRTRSDAPPDPPKNPVMRGQCYDSPPCPSAPPVKGRLPSS